MKERFKEARKALHLTQKELAEELHVSKQTIEAYEYGRTVPTDRSIADICRIHSISEEWLRYGTGEMFLPMNSDEAMSKFTMEMFENTPSELAIKLMRVVSRMDDAQIEMLVDVARKISSEYE